MNRDTPQAVIDRKDSTALRFAREYELRLIADYGETSALGREAREVIGKINKALRRRGQLGKLL